MSQHSTRFLLVLFLLALACQEAFAAKGMVIYKTHPENSDDLAIIVEYEEFKNFGTVANITPAGGGDVIRTSGKNVVQAVEYQDFTGGSFTTQQQVADLKAIPPALGELAKRFPRARDLLAEEARRINTAVQLLEQGKILVAGQWKEKTEMATASSSSGESLTITTEEGESRTYTGVRVTGQELDSLRIMHSGGAATIPYEQLTEEDQERYGFDPAKAEEFRQEKVMAQQPASVSPAPSGDSFVGTWEVVSATANSMNLLGNVMTYLRRYELREDGTLTSYQKVLENGAMKSDWQKAEDRTWRPVSGVFTDTDEPWEGFVIGGLEWGGVFVLRDGKLVHTKNSAAVSQFAALGKMRDTESLSEDELKAIRNISTADLGDDSAEEYVKLDDGLGQSPKEEGEASSLIDSVIAELTDESFDYSPENLGRIAVQLGALKEQFPRNGPVGALSANVSALTNALKSEASAKDAVESAQRAREEALTQARASLTGSSAIGLSVEAAQNQVNTESERLNTARELEQEASATAWEARSELEGWVRNHQHQKADSMRRVAEAAEEQKRKEVQERMAQAEESQKTALIPSFEEMLDGIPMGMATREFQDLEFERMRELITEKAPISSHQPILQKGEVYTVADQSTTFTIKQRVGSDLLIGDADGKPFAVVQCSTGELFDGLALLDFMARCVAVYVEDREIQMVTGAVVSLPVFQAQFVVGPDAHGSELVTIRFESSQEGDPLPPEAEKGAVEAASVPVVANDEVAETEVAKRDSASDEEGGFSWFLTMIIAGIFTFAFGSAYFTRLCPACRRAWGLVEKGTRVEGTEQVWKAVKERVSTGGAATTEIERDRPFTREHRVTLYSCKHCGHEKEARSTRDKQNR